MSKNTKKILSVAAVLAMTAALTACGSGSDTSEETTVSSETTAPAEETASASASMDLNDIQNDVQNQLATTTDVENEADRAIYKAQVVLPDGWQTMEDSSDGKFYSSANGICKIQGHNYGDDAELTPLAEMADGVAASIKMTNMFSQADTEFSEPENTTVAGRDAIKYNYTVTAYIYETDDEGKIIKENKHIAAVFKDEIYIFYDGTNAYVLSFEAEQSIFDEAKADFDKIRDSFTIAEDGTAGYEAASIYMSEREEREMSEILSSIDAMQEAEAAAEEASASVTEAPEESTEESTSAE